MNPGWFFLRFTANLNGFFGRSDWLSWGVTWLWEKGLDVFWESWPDRPSYCFVFWTPMISTVLAASRRPKPLIWGSPQRVKHYFLSRFSATKGHHALFYLRNGFRQGSPPKAVLQSPRPREDVLSLWIFTAAFSSRKAKTYIPGLKPLGFTASRQDCKFLPPPRSGRWSPERIDLTHCEKFVGTILK